MEMEAASLSLQHGGDHATSDNAQPPSPRTFLAVSPPQIGLEACPPKGWEKEREILQLQAELEAANAMVQALEGVSDGGPTASQHVPQYVPVAEPRVEEKVVYKYVQVEYEVIQERTREEPRLTTVDTLRNKLVEVEKPVYQTNVVEVERPVPVKPAEARAAEALYHARLARLQRHGPPLLPPKHGEVPGRSPIHTAANAMHETSGQTATSETRKAVTPNHGLFPLPTLPSWLGGAAGDGGEAQDEEDSRKVDSNQTTLALQVPSLPSVHMPEFALPAWLGGESWSWQAAEPTGALQSENPLPEPQASRPALVSQLVC